jgi:hypothetical protein
MKDKNAYFEFAPRSAMKKASTWGESVQSRSPSRLKPAARCERCEQGIGAPFVLLEDEAATARATIEDLSPFIRERLKNAVPDALQKRVHKRLHGHHGDAGRHVHQCGAMSARDGGLLRRPEKMNGVQNQHQRQRL